MRRRVIEVMLSDILGLHSELKAGVHWVRKVTGRKEEEEKKKKKKKEKEKEKKKKKLVINIRAAQ